jgi:hypothetical protein
MQSSCVPLTCEGATSFSMLNVLEEEEDVLLLLLLLLLR